jgi:glycine/D-amino acid oxidase-like deaminating enzyme
MPDKSVNIAVVGAGAIGAATAAFMAKAGWNTEIVCKHQEIADLAQSPGLRVFGVKGEH